MKKMYKVQHIEVNCRSCKKPVFEDDYVCPHCNITAPGIYTRCPTCKSENYLYHKYGYNMVLGIGALIVGPIGPIFGFYGYNNTECVCADCLQGWYPFIEQDLTRLNIFVGEEGKATRKFKKIPNNCYPQNK